MINDLKNWAGETKGLYRYVIASNVCYEIHILYWEFSTDILTAKASLYISGDWTDGKLNEKSYFDRELLLENKPVSECLEAVMKDYKENNCSD